MEPTAIANFGFGIKIVQHEDGQVEYLSKSANTGVAAEVIIQRMKMFLIQLEREFSGTFDKSHARFEKK